MQSSKLQFKIQNLVGPLSIIIFAVVLRLVPHPANFAPVAAMALFGGCYLNKRYAFIVPLVAMIISDYFLGFHNTIVYVYLSFLLTGLIGLWLKSHKNIQNTFGATLLSSMLFFLITNFGVWLAGELYPKTISGFFQAYVYAAPFFRNTIIGDLFYMGVFFGSYEMVLKLFMRTHPNRNTLNRSEY